MRKVLAIRPLCGTWPATASFVPTPLGHVRYHGTGVRPQRTRVRSVRSEASGVAVRTDNGRWAIAAVRLSPRHRELLTLLAAGHTLKTAARELGISPHTAHNHLRTILDRLGAHTTTQAVALAIGAGLIAPPATIWPLPLPH